MQFEQMTFRTLADRLAIFTADPVRGNEQVYVTHTDAGSIVVVPVPGYCEQFSKPQQAPKPVELKLTIQDAQYLHALGVRA